MTPRQRGWLLPPAALFLALGILLGRSVTDRLPTLLACVPVLLSLPLLRGRLRFAACLALSLTVGCLAGTLAFHPALPPEGDYAVRGIVADAPKVSAFGRISVCLSDVTLDGAPLSGNAYWTRYTDESDPLPRAGQQVAFTARLYHPDSATNPDEYDFREDLLRRGMVVGLYGGEDPVFSEPSFFSFSGWTASLRSRLSAALVRQLGEEAGGYASALLLGTRSLVSAEDRAAFSRLGIAHVLSVSGFHVGILISALALLFRLLRLPQRLRLFLYALILLFYSALCGLNQPVLRASLLTLLALEGKILNRPRSALHLLCAAWILLLLFSPVQLTGVSFQLSFGAMFGLTLVSPFLRSLFPGLQGLPRRLWFALCASLGAHLGILLPELYWYQSLPLMSLLLNIPVTLVFSLLIVADWIMLLLLPFPPLASLFAGPCAWLTSLLTDGIRRLGTLPGITLWTHASNGLTAAGVLLLFAALCVLFRMKGKHRWMLTAAGLLITCLSLLPQPHLITEYIQFSVGNADAAVLWDQNRVYVLDAGTEDGVVSGFLRRHRLTPDAVILTHLHSDHAGGLRSLLDEGIPVLRCYLPAGAEEMVLNDGIRELLADLRQNRTEFVFLSRGDELSLPSGSLSVLWPEAGRIRPNQDANNYCLVSLLNLKGVSMLHAADLTGLYEPYAAAPADILKIAHHGSPSSTSEAFVASVAPRLALLSCRWPERHSQVAERLPDLPLFSTAVSGALTLRFSEGTCTLTPFLSSSSGGE